MVKMGLLKLCFKKVGTTNKFAVEFGVENGNECNTTYLVKQGWHVLQMDSEFEAAGTVFKERIDKENVNRIFRKYKVLKNLIF